MLKESSVELDLEGFLCSKVTFIIKKLALTTSIYRDFLIFLPPVSFNSLPKSEQKAYNRLTNDVHGIQWKSSDHLHLNSIRLFKVLF